VVPREWSDRPRPLGHTVEPVEDREQLAVGVLDHRLGVTVEVGPNDPLVRFLDDARSLQVAEVLWLGTRPQENEYPDRRKDRHGAEAEQPDLECLLRRHVPASLTASAGARRSWRHRSGQLQRELSSACEAVCSSCCLRGGSVFATDHGPYASTPTWSRRFQAPGNAAQKPASGHRGIQIISKIEPLSASAPCPKNALLGPRVARGRLLGSAALLIRDAPCAPRPGPNLGPTGASRPFFAAPSPAWNSPKGPPNADRRTPGPFGPGGQKCRRDTS